MQSDSEIYSLISQQAPRIQKSVEILKISGYWNAKNLEFWREILQAAFIVNDVLLVRLFYPKIYSFILLTVGILATYKPLL